jgi:hypothetical protein
MVHHMCRLAEYVKGELKGAHTMVTQQAGTTKAALVSLQSDVSSRLDGADAAVKATEERLELVINELNDEVEQVLALV